jgi:hypothetical protein
MNGRSGAAGRTRTASFTGSTGPLSPAGPTFREFRSSVWRLYLAGTALAFEGGRMGVDQILLARRLLPLSRLPCPPGPAGRPPGAHSC